MGTPKALVDDWLERSVEGLRAGGCDDVTVVLGAESERARALLVDAQVGIVEAADWADGMGASLRAGLAAVEEDPARCDAVLVTLVDLPDVGPDVVRRVLAGAAGKDVLRRASYVGRPGHPVLIGRDHWGGVRTEATGDRGARGYLATHEVELVECGDLATGHDVDTRDTP